MAKEREPREQTFTHDGPRERVRPVSQRVETWEAMDKSSSGKREKSGPVTYVRAPARDARAEMDKERKKAAKARTTEAAQRETAEVAPTETAAADTKPAARKRTAKKNT